MLVPANVGFQEENSAPEGLERVTGVNSAGANELPLRVDTGRSALIALTTAVPDKPNIVSEHNFVSG
jgi:hypothetical protein